MDTQIFLLIGDIHIISRLVGELWTKLSLIGSVGHLLLAARMVQLSVSSISLMG